MQNTHTHLRNSKATNKENDWKFTPRKQKQNINKPHQSKAHWDARKRSHEALNNNNNARWSRHNRMRWKTVPKCNEIPIPPTVGMEQKDRRAPFTLEGFSLSLAVSVACSLSVCMWDFSRPFPFYRWASGGAACERARARSRWWGEKRKASLGNPFNNLAWGSTLEKIVAFWEKKVSLVSLGGNHFFGAAKTIFFFFVM